jgi:hypothetical protein
LEGPHADPTRGLVGKKKLVKQYLSDQMAYFARARVFSDFEFPPVATEVVSLRKYSRLLAVWTNSKLKGGVPRSLAIRNRANSRYALVKRSQSNRKVWYLVTYVSGLSGNHRPIL